MNIQPKTLECFADSKRIKKYNNNQAFIEQQ
jgi:hypothetical protein